MKQKFLKITLALFIVGGLSSCKDGAKEAETTEAQEVAEATVESISYMVDTANTTINWSGSKPTGTHTGTINVAKGMISVNDNTVEAGTFMIDMKTIECTDLEGEMKTNLEAHLMGTVEGKEGDFFNVNEFPMAEFEMTGMSEVDGKTMIEGNLTLKGETNNISFPATVDVNGKQVTITSETFAIDRTKWGVNYGSKSVFDGLGDKFISDDIELTINLVATK